MALFGRTTSSSDSSSVEYGKWVAEDATAMGKFDQAPATTRTPAKAADILDALLGKNS
jgi:hypothetical protein